MDRATAYVCAGCGDRPTDPTRHECGPDAAVELRHDYDRLRDTFDGSDSQPCISDLSRYEQLLPVDTLEDSSLGEGGTDLVDAPSLGAAFDVQLSLKLDGANPTGSTKDRGSSLVVAHAVERGDDVVACASTGNAAASLAAYAARSDMHCCLFVPEGSARAKSVQPLVYGADVLSVEGSYDDAHRLCRRVTTDRGWLDRSAGATPFTDAGARTLGYELAEQTPTVPDWVVVSMGNGGTLASTWMGLQTFAELGVIEETPQMLGVQAAGSNPIHAAITGERSAASDTCADSIDVGSPQRLEDARDALTESDGTTVSVSDESILESTTRLGQAEGVFVEPACAATVAGIQRARERGVIDAGEHVIAVLTGSGLKDTAPARRMVEEPETVSPSADPATLVDRYSSGSD